VIRAVGGPDRIAAIGITNQRETTIVWDRATGEPIADAIVWQSRITAPACERLRAAGHEPLFRERTGLPLDAYFSGPKIAHILDAVPGARARADAASSPSAPSTRSCSGGSRAAPMLPAPSTRPTFRTRAARSSSTSTGSPGTRSSSGSSMCRTPSCRRVRPSSGVFGETTLTSSVARFPIAALAGDQQAATFGQACFEPGQAKNTYGTGAFLLLNTATEARDSANGLLSTVGWQLEPGGPVTYRARGLGVLGRLGGPVAARRPRDHRAPRDVEALAASVDDTGGVYLVPAFTGLGAPHWDPNARGTIVGLTRGTGRAELAARDARVDRFQVADVLEAMAAGRRRAADASLRVDGGARRQRPAPPAPGGPARRPGRAARRRRDDRARRGVPRRPRGRLLASLDDIESNWALDRRSSRRCRPIGADRCCTAGIGRSNARGLDRARFAIGDCK
jgi:glycerol kinase